MFCAPNSIFSSGPDKRRLEEKIVGSFNACRLDNDGKKITKKIRFFRIFHPVKASPNFGDPMGNHTDREAWIGIRQTVR